MADAVVVASDVTALGFLEHGHYALESTLLGYGCGHRDLLHDNRHRGIIIELVAVVDLTPDLDHAVLGTILEVEANTVQLAIGALFRRTEEVELASDLSKRLADQGDGGHQITPVASATVWAASAVTPVSPSMVNLSGRIS